MNGFFDSVVKFLNSPAGKLTTGIAKDALNNHIFPYLRENMSEVMKLVVMSEEDKKRRAEEEFITIDNIENDTDYKI